MAAEVSFFYDILFYRFRTRQWAKRGAWDLNPHRINLYRSTPFLRHLFYHLKKARRQTAKDFFLLYPLSYTSCLSSLDRGSGGIRTRDPGVIMRSNSCLRHLLYAIVSKNFPFDDTKICIRCAMFLRGRIFIGLFSLFLP